MTNKCYKKLGYSNVVNKKTPFQTGFLLSNLDSNQDSQIQKLKYYHYTIGQK